MRYYIIAGEASGDLHGANLLKVLFKTEPDAEVRFWGGDLMQQVGGTLVKHYKDLAFMGFAEVITNLRTILKNIEFCKKDIKAFNPDVIIFIDYPGFNMRIAKWAKQQGFDTHYYISPQIWAWKEGRIKAIKRDVNQMYVILPFEKDFYEKKHQYPVHYVGHPLLDEIEEFKKNQSGNFNEKHQLDDRPIIALLPGSRKQEISRLLTEMLRIVNDYPQFQFVIAGAPSLNAAFYQPFIKQENVKLILNDTYNLLNNAYAAIVTSGTATLETALFNVPQVVVYKGNEISYQIARRIINLKYISLVNLIMDEPIVTELIQNECNTTNIKKEFDKVINKNYRDEMFVKYRELSEKLGGGGASERVVNILRSF
ncbi:lipid-A-disaccharide synthase [Paenimyroides aquimaris]|uniref:Lipid-A-disaccharide synthase n=1 Tax=Paenimyroides marinum TaxID=1159016 RepID=A0A1H6M7S3_9FLAO|nr:lipid-A-disaccharide synthase [Paenimyroides aquimaris]SEH93575.1 lipid-A-disaccharide synthase [Paenimyroides aquimaris]